MTGYGIKANRSWNGQLMLRGDNTDIGTINFLVPLEEDAGLRGLGRPALLAFIDGDAKVKIEFTDDWGKKGDKFEWDLHQACINIAAFSSAQKLTITRVDADVTYTVVAR